MRFAAYSPLMEGRTLIKSMTGYGRAVRADGDLEITAEIRAVNNRYLDCTVKLPRLYGYAEDPIKQRVKARVSRGKVDVFLTVNHTGGTDVSVTLNRPVLEGYLAAMKTMAADYAVRDDISVSSLSRLPEVFLVDKPEVDEETVRLRSHLKQLASMVQGGGPIGRKLDFLLQEMNRETNTIGSKCADLHISEIVVEMKAELEKIREQIQNVE